MTDELKPTERHPYTGRITISRYTSNCWPETGIRITIMDESSRAQFFEGEITVEALGFMLTGLSVECIFNIRAADLIGTKAEYKTEIVPVEGHRFKSNLDRPSGLKPESEALADEVLKPFEIDGWRGSRRDLSNPRNKAAGGQSVGFSRHVNAETGDPIIR